MDNFIFIFKELRIPEETIDLCFYAFNLTPLTSNAMFLPAGLGFY
jgi:hypothetical protein